MLSPEQVKMIKVQILEHVQMSFPEDKKEFAKKQVELMDANQLEDFLRNNNLALGEHKNLVQADSSFEGQCIFCSIVVGDTSSYKISENEEAIAILEINPLSRGHVLVIPKKHLGSKDKITPSVSNFAKKIGDKIKSLLKPEDVSIKNSNMFGHEIINIIPLYKEDLHSGKTSERYRAAEEELLSLQKLLSEKKEKKILKRPATKKIKKSEKFILPRRIP